MLERLLRYEQCLIPMVQIITDSEPFRTTFIPANEDLLSHIAVYTLSNQYQEPIRIFGAFIVHCIFLMILI